MRGDSPIFDLEARVLEFAGTLLLQEELNLVTVKTFMKPFGANINSKGIKGSQSDIIIKLKTHNFLNILGNF